MTDWRWVSVDLAFAIHDRQISEHGGRAGLRGRGLLESAIHCPETRAADGEPDAAELAAAYAFGLAKNHGFVDGDKRTAWVVARVFLADNGLTLGFDRLDAIRTAEGLAVGVGSEDELARWFRARLS